MASIVANQKASFLRQAQRDAARAAESLQHVHPAERFAILATLIAASDTPCDLVLITSEHADGVDAAQILDGVLPRAADTRWGWMVGSGCLAQIECQDKNDPFARETYR